jgi:hypothetical protein
MRTPVFRPVAQMARVVLAGALAHFAQGGGASRAGAGSV